jgi:hypothetical protein
LGCVHMGVVKNQLLQIDYMNEQWSPMGLGPLGPREQCFIFKQPSRMAIAEWPPMANGHAVRHPSIHPMYMYKMRQRDQ